MDTDEPWLQDAFSLVTEGRHTNRSLIPHLLRTSLCLNRDNKGHGKKEKTLIKLCMKDQFLHKGCSYF